MSKLQIMAKYLELTEMALENTTAANIDAVEELEAANPWVVDAVYQEWVQKVGPVGYDIQNHRLMVG